MLILLYLLIPISIILLIRWEKKKYGTITQRRPYNPDEDPINRQYTDPVTLELKKQTALIRSFPEKR